MRKPRYFFTSETPLRNVIQMVHGVLTQNTAPDGTASLRILIRRYLPGHWLANATDDVVFRTEVNLSTRHGIVSRAYVCKNDLVRSRENAEITIEHIRECLGARIDDGKSFADDDGPLISALRARNTYLESAHSARRAELMLLRQILTSYGQDLEGS